MPDIVDEVMNRITTIRETGEPIGLSTGLRWLDAKIYGLCPTDLYIVAARPGMGKSALAMTFAMHQAVDLSIPILLFSLEMSAGQLVSRALSRLSGVPHEWLKNPGGLSHIQLADMGNAAARLKDRPLFIDDQAALTVEQIRARSIRIHKEHGIQAVYVDYIQLVAPSGGRGRSREQEVSEVSRGLKALAKELKIPVVALSQLSRKIEERQKSDQRPKLSDLRESGAIEQDADCVVFIYSPQNFNPDVTMAEAELIVAKHRNGSVGTVKATFEKNTVHFSEREAEQYSPLAPPREEKDNPF
jgi:replicative DNA helicase